ncbi:MAG TPA: magnesium/cobalt transporter CorA [Candidatus Krumholzibacteria bacterium]|nr:magnesium/cobalt transporter CorA [Candidatus Krumholzibacteria bacterium]
MPNLFGRRNVTPGAPPGELVYRGEKRVEEVSIRVMDYTPGACHVAKTVKVEDTYPLRDSDTVSWIDIVGLHDTDLLGSFGEHFGLHPLVMEDILNTHQRPKLEEYDDYFYVVARMLIPGKGGEAFHTEQVSFVLGKHFVATFQETAADVFDPVRNRVEQGGKSRRMGPDYLLYVLLDAMVDNYFVVLQGVAERIENVERIITGEDPKPHDLDEVHHLRREMVYLRRYTWPLRDVVAELGRSDSPLISEETQVYLRDLHDHVMQVIESMENFRDVLASMQDLYLSVLSNRTNEVIRILTIISFIFVPLTFLAGVYGMNFKYFPEIEWRHGYEAFWVLSVVVVIGLVAYLRRRGWL